ncbi:MAG TPA: cytochrome P450, partial [Spirochaetia bacterium]|nr:cytochrome P450 [Spirochaetia bacterium]
SPENEQKRPGNSYLPFGVGQRSCIGRFFAIQEATVVLATLLHRFKLQGDPGYQLKIAETITLKPSGFAVRATPMNLARNGGGKPAEAAPAEAPKPDARAGAEQIPLLVLFGSNMGTSEELARQLAADGETAGFAVETAPLDDCPTSLPARGALVVVASSYNGNPPDNAIRFGSRLGDGSKTFEGVRYAVFGCGHHDWAATFQAFPTFIDTRLAALGGISIMERGSGDSGGDLFGDFRVWRRALWGSLSSALGIKPLTTTGAARAPLYAVEIVNEQQPNPFVVSFGARRMVVSENRELQLPAGSAPPERSTRHIELALPEGVTYRPGDHLGVIALNNRETVRRVLTRFGLDNDTVVRLRAQGKGRTSLPTDRAISVATLLSEYVELQDVTTQDQIAVLMEHAQNPSERAQLAALCGEDEASRERYREEILRRRVSLVDLLEEYPGCAVPFGTFLEMLSPLRPRYYSISSSPLKLRNICSITVGVLDEPARSGRGRYRGVCSAYLSSKPKGASVDAFVRDPGSPFRPPRNPRTPIVMAAAGTGIAPFIGFLQERAWLKEHDYAIGPSLLFFGCRRQDTDFYYHEELQEHQRNGVVHVVTAFSREIPGAKLYAQDRIRDHADEVWELFQAGAVIYVCGDAGTLAPAVRSAVGAIFQQKTGCSEEKREEWLNDLVTRQRYIADVWAST